MFHKSLPYIVLWTSDHVSSLKLLMLITNEDESGVLKKKIGEAGYEFTTVYVLGEGRGETKPQPNSKRLSLIRSESCDALKSDCDVMWRLKSILMVMSDEMSILYCDKLLISALYIF